MPGQEIWIYFKRKGGATLKFWSIAYHLEDLTAGDGNLSSVIIWDTILFYVAEYFLSQSCSRQCV